MFGRTLKRYVIACNVGGQAVRIAVVATGEAAAKVKADRIAKDMASRINEHGLQHRQGAVLT